MSPLRRMSHSDRPVNPDNPAGADKPDDQGSSGNPGVAGPTAPTRRIGLRRPPALVAGGALAVLVVGTIVAADALAAGRSDRLAATSFAVTQATSPSSLAISTTQAPDATEAGGGSSSSSSGASADPSTSIGPVTAEPGAGGPAPSAVPDSAPATAAPATAAPAPAAPAPAAPTAPAPPAPVAPPASSVRGPAASPGKIGIPAIPLAAYQRAASRLSGCGAPWWLLAGIGKVESNHAGGGRVDRNGKVRGAIYGPRLDGSLAGTAVIADTDKGALDGDPDFDRAVGPMQFLPGTWRSVRRDGNGDRVTDPQNIYDAALSAAVYLCRSGSLKTEPAMTRALWSYNGSASYVRTVMGYAKAYRDAAEPKPTANPTPTATAAARAS